MTDLRSNAVGKSGVGDSVSVESCALSSHRCSSDGQCVAKVRDLNPDSHNPESPEAAVSVGREGL